MGLLRLYSDKSNTLLKASAFVFCTVNDVFLSFNNESIIEKTVNEYIPIVFDRSNSDNKAEIVEFARKQSDLLIHKCLVDIV